MSASNNLENARTCELCGAPKCDRCGNCFTPSALLSHGDGVYCQGCWRHETRVNHGARYTADSKGSGLAVLLLILILALVLLLPFWLLL
jgi:hypothetical protein